MSRFNRREVLMAASAVAWAKTSNAAEFEVLSDRPKQLQTPIEALDGLMTPTERFFVRSHFGNPAFNLNRTLKILGEVKTPLSFRLSELKSLPHTSVTAVLQCAGNGRALFSPPIPGVQWTHGAMGQAEWKGVSVRTLLEKAGLSSKAAHIHLIGADRVPRPQTPPFIRSIPLEKAMESDTLVAWNMNGQPLTLDHGAPLRLVVPGWAGDHWLKWLTEIHVSQEEHPGFFVQKAYRMPKTPVAPGTKVAPEDMEPVTVMPVKSIITFPLEGSQIPSGLTDIRGVAFSGSTAIQKVEVSVDGGKTWEHAELEGAPGKGRWQRFRVVAKMPVGRHSALARATDETGAVQPSKAIWNPSGYYWNAWHQVNWSAV